MGWQTQDEGPRPYTIKVEAARFEPSRNKSGDLIQYGEGVGLLDLVLEGPLAFLDEDYAFQEEGKPDVGDDLPSRNFTMGDTQDFADEDGTGEKLSFRRRHAPKSRFRGGQIFKSLIDVAGEAWLEDNMPDWEIAQTWVGHEYVIHPQYRMNADGDYVMNRAGDMREVDYFVVGIDGQGVTPDLSERP